MNAIDFFFFFFLLGINVQNYVSFVIENFFFNIENIDFDHMVCDYILQGRVESIEDHLFHWKGGKKKSNERKENGAVMFRNKNRKGFFFSITLRVVFPALSMDECLQGVQFWKAKERIQEFRIGLDFFFFFFFFLSRWFVHSWWIEPLSTFSFASKISFSFSVLRSSVVVVEEEAVE